MLIREREKRCRAGTTLIEVVIALLVISITSFNTFKMIDAALGLIRSSQNRLIAQNLANEGLEIIENAVDTNIIRYSDLSCWNLDPNWQPPCNSNKQLSGNYRLIVQEPLALKQFDVLLDKSSSGDLNLSDETKAQSNEAYRLSIKGDFMTFDQNAPPENKTKFYRMIKIEYDADNNMNIAALVQWKHWGAVRTMKTEGAINNKL